MTDRSGTRETYAPSSSPPFRPGARRTWASRARAWLGPLAAVALVALVAGCGGEYPQSTIDPQTEFADVIHSIYTSIFWWTVVIGVAVWLAMGYILVRFREKPDAEKPEQTHGHLGLEIGWTIGPALIVVAIAIPTIQAVFATQRPYAEEDGALTVEVVGHRFWWEFRYPDGVVTANELHLPVDRPVNLKMHSADVIHSFWVPQLGGKRDVNPVVRVPEGEDPDYTWLHFTPRTEGTFMGQCAEFCGPSHSLMGVRVVVEPASEFEAWREAWRNPGYSAAQWPPAVAAPADTAGEADPEAGADTAATAAPATTDQEELVAEGRRVFFEESYCVLCHAINGTSAAGNIGPDLTNVGARQTLGAGLLENTPENMMRWIRDPASIKPGVEMPGATTPAPRTGGGQWQPLELDEEQLEAVTAYLQSLTGDGS